MAYPLPELYPLVGYAMNRLERGDTSEQVRARLETSDRFGPVSSSDIDSVIQAARGNIRRLAELEQYTSGAAGATGPASQLGALPSFFALLEHEIGMRVLITYTTNAGSLVQASVVVNAPSDMTVDQLNVYLNELIMSNQLSMPNGSNLGNDLSKTEFEIVQVFPGGFARGILLGAD